MVDDFLSIDDFKLIFFFIQKPDANPPSTSVRFLKDGQLIQPETGVLIANQTLVLQQVKRRFKSTITCEASNSVGRSSSNDLYLRIQCKF